MKLLASSRCMFAGGFYSTNFPTRVCMEQPFLIHTGGTYFGELLVGIAHNATFNTTVAEMYWKGAMDSTLVEFQHHLRSICGKKLGPHAMSLLQSFRNNALHTREKEEEEEESVKLEDYLGVASSEMVVDDDDVEIAEFPPSQQDQLVGGPQQLRSCFVILRREELENLRTEIQNTTTKSENMMIQCQNMRKKLI